MIVVQTLYTKSTNKYSIIGIYLKNIFFAGIFLLIFSSIFLNECFAGNNSPDEDSSKRKSTLKNLPYYMDDILLIGGLNHSGIYMSNHFRELSYSKGFQVGIENYFPISKIAFLNYGIHYTRKNFRFSAEDIPKTYFSIPLFLSFELPEFQAIDFRFLLGTQFSYLLASGNNSTEIYNSPHTFLSEPDNLYNFGYGWTFGISGEYKSIYFRARSYLGLNKIDPNDQGMMNSIHFDLGFFFLRGFRK